MHDSLLGRRNFDRLCLVACALLAAACETGVKGTSSSSGAAGQAGVTFSVNVSRPVGGRIRSEVGGAPDGKIDCGTKGGSANACDEVSYSWSQTVTFTAIPDDGFKFAGWAADCLGTAPTCSLDTTQRGADKWVAAVFEPVALYPGTWFRVTVERPTGGLVSSADGRIRCGTAANANLCGPALFRWAETATLTATPDAGYKFDAWSGDCTGSGPCTLDTAVSATDKSLGAVFVSSCAPGYVEAACSVANSFRISDLTSNSCSTIDTYSAAGYYSGTLGVSGSRVFETGEIGAVGAALDLTSASPILANYGALFSDLRTETVYAAGAFVPFAYWESGVPFQDLYELDSVTGLATWVRVPLSRPLTLNWGSAIFHGWGRALFFDGVRIYDISLPSGVVTDLGPITLSNRYFWGGSVSVSGVAEHFGGNLYVAYRSGNQIVRTRVTDGFTEAIHSFGSLSNLDSFTVAPRLSRWFWHYNSAAELGGTGANTLGACDAAFSTCQEGATSCIPAAMVCSPFRTNVTAERPWNGTSYGACVPTGACSPGYSDCDGAAANGCEAVLEFDAANCGACGVACADGERCWEGTCGQFAGVTVTAAQLTSSVAASSAIPTAFNRTHDGGSVVDSDRGVIWSSYGIANGTCDQTTNPAGPYSLHYTSIGTGAAGTIMLPFGTHGSYPVYDRARTIYMAEGECGSMNRVATIDASTHAVTFLPASPEPFCDFCKPAYQSGAFWRESESRKLLRYDDAFGWFTIPGLVLPNSCNLDADLQDPDVLWAMCSDSNLYKYTVSTNTLTYVSTRPTMWSLGGNEPTEFVPGPDGKGFIVTAWATSPWSVYDIAAGAWLSVSWPYSTYEPYWGQTGYDVRTGTLYFQLDGDTVWRKVQF